MLILATQRPLEISGLSYLRVFLLESTLPVTWASKIVSGKGFLDSSRDERNGALVTSFWSYRDKFALSDIGESG